MSNGYLLLGKDVQDQEMRDDGDYISFVWICHIPFLDLCLEGVERVEGHCTLIATIDNNPNIFSHSTLAFPSRKNKMCAPENVAQIDEKLLLCESSDCDGAASTCDCEVVKGCLCNVRVLQRENGFIIPQSPLVVL